MSQEPYKKQVEAVLFTLGRPVSIEQLSEMLGLGSLGIVKDSLEHLKQEYAEKDSALEILEDNGKFRMNIKGEHMHLVRDLMPVTELDKQTIETLAIIAWKQPVLQADVVKIRGNKTYDHMKVLAENDFVTTSPKGLSKIIKLTPKFYQYFDTNTAMINKALDDEASKREIPEPGPQIVPSEEMPRMPGQDIDPGEIGLKEKKKNTL